MQHTEFVRQSFFKKIVIEKSVYTYISMQSIVFLKKMS